MISKNKQKNVLILVQKKICLIPEKICARNPGLNGEMVGVFPLGSKVR